MGIGFIDVRLSTMSVDLRGLPFVDGDYANFKIQRGSLRLSAMASAVLVLDELMPRPTRFRVPRTSFSGA